MPPQSDLERLKEIQNRIHDRHMVSQADAGALNAIHENVTGEVPGEDVADVAAADAMIADLRKQVEKRDRIAVKKAGNTSDDEQGSVELGTDAVHRGADQSADDKPTPDAPVDPAAAKQDKEEATSSTADAVTTDAHTAEETGDEEEIEEEVEEEVDEVDAENKPTGKKKTVKKTVKKKTGAKKTAGKTAR